jgi:hypothetical protein
MKKITYQDLWNSIHRYQCAKHEYPYATFEHGCLKRIVRANESAILGDYPPMVKPISKMSSKALMEKAEAYIGKTLTQTDKDELTVILKQLEKRGYEISLSTEE